MSYNGKILIVDDDSRMCNSLRALLNMYNFQIQTCDNGYDALNFIGKGTYDLVLLDLIMKKMDGFQVMESITNKNLDTTIIVISGNNSINSPIQALKKGAYDYFRKPFEPDELLTSVKNALYHRRLKEAKQQIEREKDELIFQLKKDKAEIKKLIGIIPICSNCKNVRDDMGRWVKIEAYISKHSEASFSHGICPKCSRELYPDFH